MADDHLRTLLGRYPSGVCVVTVDAGGQKLGLTVGSLVSLSLDPPLVGFAVSRDAALLGLATAMAYFVSYEWLHLAYHLPSSSRVFRLPWLARLREHHRRHHDPRLMKRWNFNVTVPVFDLLHRTRWPRVRGVEEEDPPLPGDGR